MPTNTGSAPPKGEIDNSSRASFARTAYPYALDAAGGDPELAKRLIASAISENGTVGSGKPIGVGFNFGGIKQDPVYGVGSGTYGTWESEGGQRVNQNDSFAHYPDAATGFKAIPAFLQRNFPKQWAQYQQDHDAAALYRNINAAGYATDQNWHQAIEGIAARDVEPNVRGTQTPTAAASETSGAQGAQPTADLSTRYPRQDLVDRPDKWAICGPIAVIAAGAAMGKTIDLDTAVKKAYDAGWRPNAGMAGPSSEIATMQSLGIPARAGAIDLAMIKHDTDNGNVVILSSPGESGHYFVVQGVDAQGRLDLGNSALTLTASKGRRTFTLDELRALGPIGAVDTAIYVDNPRTPVASVGASTPNAAGSPTPVATSQAPAASSPAAGAISPLPPDAMYRMGLEQPSDTPPPDGGVSSTHEAGRFIPTPNYEPTGPAMRGVTPDVAYPRPGQRNRAVPGGDVTEVPGPSVDPTYYGRNRAVPGDTAEWREGGWATPPDPASGGPYGLGTPLSYRQPLTPTAQADPLAPPPQTGPAGSPPNPDQGPHESGYRLSPGTPIPIQNADGSVSTELSITVTDPRLNGGRPTNIPSVWGGLRQSEDDAIEFATRSGIDWPSFNSIKQAEQAARQRSYDLGTGAQTSVGGASGVAPADRRNQAVPGVVDEQGGGMLPSGMSYRQPLDGSSTQDFLPGDGGTAPEPAGQRPYDPDQGPHELPPPDLTPTAAPAPVWTPGQPLPADLGLSPTQGPPAPTPASPLDLGNAAQQAQRSLKPVWDAAGNTVGYVQESAGQGILGEGGRSQEEKDRANAYAREQAGITNAPDNSAVYPALGSMAPPLGGTPQIIDEMAPIQQRAAAFVAQRGRPDRTGGLQAVDDPEWRRANPEDAARYDDLRRSYELNVMGQTLPGGPEPARPTSADANAGASLIDRVGAHLAENRAGVAALDAERAGRPGVATYGTLGFSPAEQEMRGLTRTPVVPPDVAVGLGVPRRIPDDPRLAQAVEAAGGTITDRGVELNLTRAQGEGAAGRPASRGGVFYEAVPEGGRSNYAKPSDNPLGVGGSQVIPPAPTVIRSPLVLDAAPGENQGFNQAMRCAAVGSSGVGDAPR
jgi:hypothetical protein